MSSALFLLSLIFLKFMVNCFLHLISFFAYIVFIVFEKLCWHFLKCRMNIHSSRRDVLLPLQDAWEDYWSGTTIDSASGPLDQPGNKPRLRIVRRITLCF